MSLVRYAIRMSADGYSNGPRQAKVPFNKAKLWTNIGHVKNHLNGISTPYPKGTEIVQVEIVHQEKVLGTVEDVVAEAKQRENERKREQEISLAKSELEAAKKRLKEAQANAKRKGVR